MCDPLAEVAPDGGAGGGVGRGGGVLAAGRRRVGACSASRRHCNGSGFCGAVPPDLYAMESTRLSCSEVDGVDGHILAGVRAGTAQVVVVDECLCVAGAVDRVEPDFNTPETADGAVAEAVVLLKREAGDAFRSGVATDFLHRWSLTYTTTLHGQKLAA